MSGTNIFRLILTALVIAWATVEFFPVKDSPFESYMLDSVTAQANDDGTVIADAEASREEFKALLDRVNEKVDADAAVTETEYPTLFIALQKIANDEGIDLSDYFQDIKIRDIKNLRKKNKILVTELLNRSKGELKFGLDLAGGVAITFAVDESGLSDSGALRQQQLEDARNVILDRVDGLGVAEPVVRVKGDNLIEVQMPGINTQANPNIADTIGAPALLEFKLVNRTTRPTPGATPPLGYQEARMESENPRSGELEVELLYVKKIPIMTGEIISDSRPQITQTGGYEVTMNFTNEGQDQFAEATAQIASENTDFSVGRLAIILDGKLVSAPTVRERINSPSARITGSFSQREAIELANALNNPLAVKLEVAEMYEVGPTLAKDARSASIRAALFGGLLVVAFMIIYYGVFGFVSMIAVAVNLFLVLGALSSFNATLTLPGVAALVLTIGMAVDASILIFERIREELDLGKSIHSSLTAGFDKAFSTILDANVTTLITACILVWLGTGPVRGFGITLAAGIVATVFCALIVVRWILELLVTSGMIQKPFRFRLFRATKFEFLNYAKPAFIGSWILVAVCMASLAYHWNSAFGIDFTGGEELSITYEQRISAVDVSTVAESATFLSENGEELPFGEANTFFQTPLGADREIMVVQTELDKGDAFFKALTDAYPESGLELVGQTQIGSSVGSNVTKSAIYSLLAAILAILVYIAFRFEFGFGLGAVVATLHDIFMTIGVFVILGEIFGVGSGQFTAPMIAAILMTVGYSINDTIVVFDRIREELDLNPGMNLRKVVHFSINRVLSRTVLTSVTTIFASATLFLFGAGVIKDFALVFLIGILTGTFSSMFIATPVFFRYHRGDRKSVEKGEIIPTYDWTAEEKPTKPAAV